MAENTYISLFSGYGGLDLAVRCALPEARCVCYVERETPAAAILASRMEDGGLEDAPIWSDIVTFPSRLFRGRVAGLVGGFPCQDLSVAGRQAGIEGERSGLFFEIIRLVRELESVEWLFLENVPPVLAFPAGTTVLGELAKIGFDVEWGTIRASDVGGSHRRERAFVLAYRTGRGLGKLRESSGGGGFVDRGGADVEVASGPRVWDQSRNAGRGTWTPNVQQGHRAAGSIWLGSTGENVEDASGNGGTIGSNEHRSHAAGAAKPESADKLVGPGQDVDDAYTGWPHEHRGTGTSEGQDGQREATDQPGGANDALANAPSQRHEEPGYGGERQLRAQDEEWMDDRPEQCSRQLADTSRPRLPQPQRCEPYGPLDGGEASGPASEFHRALFPPGPADLNAWRQVPEWLHPAVEPGLRRLADGANTRVDRLRAAGNGVVPLQGAVALALLLGRAR